MKFLAYVATVINGNAGTERQSEKTEIIIDAARRFLDAVGVSGEDAPQLLREACRLSKVTGK